jgi:hypothetical protein
VIYKVQEKSLLAEEVVKGEIAREISKQRLDNLLQEVTAGVQWEFNPEYFSAARALPAGQQSPGRQK